MQRGDPVPPTSGVSAQRTDSTIAAIDESLYSRQLYVMGHEAQRRLAAATVLVIGLTGTGTEIAKDLALAGFHALHIYDPTPLAWRHMAANFYAYDETQLGVPLQTVVLPHLMELNPYCHIQTETAESWAALVEPDRIRRFSAVVLVNELSIEKHIELDRVCRSVRVPLVVVQSRGVFGYVMNDFGDAHTVLDENGEDPRSIHVNHISNEERACVTCLEDQRHDLEEGMYVIFTEVDGMPMLNDPKSMFRVVQVTSPYSFVIDADTRDAGVYRCGGIVTEVKVPRTVHFRPLEALYRIQDPACIPCNASLADLIDESWFVSLDVMNQERAFVSHLLFQALSRLGRLPASGADAEMSALMAWLPPEVQEKHEALVRAFVRTANGELAPMASILGGIAAQEVLKAVTGKFTPIHQIFSFNALEALPTPLPSEAECAPRGCRYDGQIAVLGRPLQETIHELAYFCVGAGAIGAELLKCWACMGLGLADHKGLIAITDMDTIERSNLNRQFLFRATDIGRSKSLAARDAVLRLNPALHVQAHEVRVGPDTEQIFSDDFWEPLDGVCTALDNVDARLYIDQRCIYYLKPMLDSGTLGTKGSTQVVIPYLTESYGSSRDPPEKSIPMCTLKNFPYRIEHTLQWARDLFEGLFKASVEDTQQYLQRGSEYIVELEKQGPGIMVGALENVLENLQTHRPESFADCVTWARVKFEDLYTNNIRQLLHAFPSDMIDSSGQPFWSGTKRAPKPIQFNPDDSLHMDFMMAAANLRAESFGIAGSRDRQQVRALVADVSVPAFEPRAGVKIAASEEEAQASGAAVAPSVDQQRVEQMLARLPPPEQFSSIHLQPLDFEKDSDERWDMDFVTAASNLRAVNYAIPLADKHKSRGIAGRIIPAIATSTALVAGLVCLEIYKLAHIRPVLRTNPRILSASTFSSIATAATTNGAREATVDRAKVLERFRNSYVNLALSLFHLSEPIQAPLQPMSNSGNRTFSLWDRMEVDGGGRDLTLAEFMDYFERAFGLHISMLSCGVAILFSGWLAPKKAAERRATPLTELARTIGKIQLTEKDRYLVFEVMAEDASSGEEVEVPFVRYRFRL
ncbi:E1 ubiquitin-activating protein [Cyanidiococcus yangmingshanensis]|uniref:E1 ubiquitin-activating enzyme n=1 Tax=Cyanidiococcus yangmingshanensis TaxID=2690220 RepID=A0A7J7IG68_9RHOD|nr:E1 ubiquitin-activating protein [Cyanidiococcus yangmingshanensis]